MRIFAAAVLAAVSLVATFVARPCSTSACYSEISSDHWLDLTDPFRGVQFADENQSPEVGDPVWPGFLEFHTSVEDFDLGGPFPLRFRRYYAQMASGSAGDFYQGESSPMGLNWIHSYMLFAKKIGSDRALIYYVNGQLLDFQRQMDGSFVSIQAIGYQGTPYQLIQSGTKIELLDPVNDVILTFEFDALADQEVTPIERIRDRNGNGLDFTYNLDSTLAQVADDLGRTLSFAYMDSGGFPRVVSVTDQSGRMTTFGYDGADLASASDRRGNATLYGYDASQFGSPLSTITLPEGNVLLSQVVMPFDSITQADGEGNVATIEIDFAPFPPGPDDLTQTIATDPLGNTVTFLTQPGGITPTPSDSRPRGRIDQAGLTTDLALDELGRVITVTDRLGDATSITYDSASGKVASRTDALGNVWTYTYSPSVAEGFTFFDLARIDYPDGTSTRWTRDAAGNWSSRTDRDGGVTSRTRNMAGQVLSETNPLGGVTTFTYNADGTVASRIDPAGNTTTFGYDAVKRLTLVTPSQAMGKGVLGSRSIEYDDNDHVTTLIDETGSSRTFTYDANGNLLTVSDDLAQTTTFTYDANDRLVMIADPLAAQTAFSRDELGRIETRTNARGDATNRAYDARGRQISSVDPLGNVTMFGYDDEGVLASVTDPTGNQTLITTDARGRPTSITDPVGNTTTLTYDALARLRSQTSPTGIATTFEYDGESRLLALAQGDLGAEYARDGSGNVTMITDPRGNARTRSYDASGRLTTVTDAVGDAVSHTYDERNRLATSSAAGLTRTLRYDAANRPLEATFSDQTAPIAFSYDAAGRLTAASGVAFAYDAAGRLSMGNGIVIERDAVGRISRLTLEAGIILDYAYDGRGLPTAVTDWLGGVTTLSYDARGLLTQIAAPNGVTTDYAYDSAGRLTSLVTLRGTTELGRSAITRDEDGRIIESAQDYPLTGGFTGADQAFTHDAADRVEGFTFDSAGRLTSDGVNTFTWDGASRLIEHVPPADFDTVTFAYDAFGHRLERTEGASTTTYTWNYALRVPSVAITEGPQGKRYYIHTPTGALLYHVDASSEARTTYHFDETGATRFLTDDAGALLGAYFYGPYGEPIARSGENQTPFTWGGQFGVMREGQFYYMRARYYDPRTARFLTRDPLGENPFDLASLNLYAFARQDPVQFADPLGLEPKRDKQAIKDEIVRTQRLLDEAEAALGDAIKLREETVIETLPFLGPELFDVPRFLAIQAAQNPGRREDVREFVDLIESDDPNRDPLVLFLVDVFAGPILRERLEDVKDEEAGAEAAVNGIRSSLNRLRRELDGKPPMRMDVQPPPEPDITEVIQ